MKKIVKVTGFLAGFCISCAFTPLILSVFTVIFLIGFIFSPRESIQGLKEDLKAIYNKFNNIFA